MLGLAEGSSDVSDPSCTIWAEGEGKKVAKKLSEILRVFEGSVETCPICNNDTVTAGHAASCDIAAWIARVEAWEKVLHTQDGEAVMQGIMKKEEEIRKSLPNVGIYASIFERCADGYRIAAILLRGGPA